MQAIKILAVFNIHDFSRRLEEYESFNEILEYNLNNFDQSLLKNSNNSDYSWLIFRADLV